MNILRIIGLSAAVGLISSCADTRNVENEAKSAAEDLYIVDCMLPNQIRKLGNMTYAAPRKAIRTTASDCEIRGGEYVSYDRADYRTALKVWLESAEKGDAVAQNYVGEIFEKGLGTEPDYISAVSWYKQSAKQGNSRAQINLGYLYEQGLGVEKDPLMAMNFYRQASGIEGDELILSSDAKAQIAQLTDDLTKKIARESATASALSSQLSDLKKQLSDESSEAKVARLEQEVAMLEDLFKESEANRLDLDSRLQDVNLAYRNVQSSPVLQPEASESLNDRYLKELNFGSYYALIIGNKDYRYLEPLKSPLYDAQQLQNILENKYGFETVLLPNADEKSILNALNKLNEVLTDKDNLLVFYAGHGNLSLLEQTERQRGYWLPIDAQQDNISRWINNSVINDHLDRLPARSVLVVADSCYAGQLGAESSALLFGTSNKMSEAALKIGLKHRSRIVISSGGNKPVVDGTETQHSIFTSALLDVLSTNDQVIRDSMLFSRIGVNVKERNAIANLEQNPEMKAIRSAGHEGGSFYFIPK